MGHVDVFELDLYVIDLSVGLLGSTELGTGAEEGGGGRVDVLGQELVLVARSSAAVRTLFGSKGSVRYIGASEDDITAPDIDCDSLASPSLGASGDPTVLGGSTSIPASSMSSPFSCDTTLATAILSAGCSSGSGVGA